MVVDNREAWKAREEDYRAQSRKRSRKSKVRARARYLWDSVDPPTKWDDLIPRWQASVARYVRCLEEGMEPRDAWDYSSPSHHTHWDARCLARPVRDALEEVARAAG